MTIPETRTARTRRIQAASVALLLVAFAFDAPASAADRPAIAAVNIGMQAGLTLVRSAIQRKVHSRRQLVRTLLWGGVSGAGFYGAKELVASDRYASGWLVANVAMSVSENVAVDRHPLAQIGYSVGPVRLRIPLPTFQKDADARVYVDGSAYQALALIGAIASHDRMTVKGGMLAFERDVPYRDFDGPRFVGGETFGIFPGAWAGSRERGLLDAVWRHEAVHAVQGLQFEAVEPSFAFLTNDREGPPSSKKQLIRFEHLKLGLISIAADAIQASTDRPWREIEAYRLANDADF